MIADFPAIVAGHGDILWLARMGWTWGTVVGRGLSWVMREVL
jgi:hypothetical protein